MTAEIQILVVEDENIVALDLENQLNNLGYTVAGMASSGEDAINKAAKVMPNLVLMDIRLKGAMDGVTAASHIQQELDIPIVYLTAHTDEQTLGRAKITGPFGYLLKPFADKELKIAIEMAIYKHKMERRLRESERWLATTLRSIGEAVIATDKQGRIKFMNPVAETLTGWLQGEALEQEITQVFKLIDGKTHAQVPCSFIDTLQEQGRIKTNQTLLVSKKATEILIDCNVAPIKDDKNRVSGAVLVFRDITEEKQVQAALQQARDELELRVAARTSELESINRRLQQEIIERREIEEALRESEERFRILFESSPDAIMLINPHSHNADWEIIECNEVACRMNGYRREEMVGQSIDLLHPEPAPPQERTAYLERLRQEGQMTLETYHRRKDGTVFPIEVSTSLISLSGQEVVLGIDRDITERKQTQEALQQAHDELEQRVEERTAELLESNAQLQAEVAERQRAEAALRESEELYRTLVNTSPEAVTVADLKGRIIEVSQQTLSIHGFEQAGELVGRSNLELVAPEDQARAIADRQQGIEKGLLRQVDYALVKKDGTLFIGEVSLAVVKDTNGNPKALVTTTRDITKRKQLEARLAAIHHLGQELTLLRDQQSIIHRVLETTANILRFDTAGCGLVDEMAQELKYRYYVVGGEQYEIEKSLSLEETDLQNIGLAVLHSKQPINVPDTNQDTRYLPFSGDLPGRSALCVPMRVWDRIIGVLHAESLKPNYFTPADEQLLQTLADKTAVALENARLYDRMQQWVEELTTLHQISQTISTTMDLQQRLNILTEYTTQLLNVAVVRLILRDPIRDDLQLVAVSGPITNFLRGKRISLGQGIVGWVVEHGEPALVPDVSKDPRFFGDFDQEGGFITHSILCVPLRTRGQIIGAIEAINKRNAPFDQDDLRFLSLLAGQSAVSIENARLYQNLQNQMKTLQATQAQLVLSERMAALGRLVASIAHEINNPLQAIQGFLNLLEEEVSGHHRQGKIDSYLNIAQNEIERISAIIRGMRDFYRPTSPGQKAQTGTLADYYRSTPTDLQLVDIHTILDNVLQLTNKKLQHTRIRVERNWAEKLSAIQANSDHLKQVFLNLTLNAIDAMQSEGGTLRITTALDETELHGNLPQPVVRVEFSDTGTGMSPELLSHVFDPLFSTKGHGSGFGLFTSYYIVEAHQGQITATGQEGEGTTFTVFLPLERQ